MPDSSQHESRQGSSAAEQPTDQTEGGRGPGDTHRCSDGPRQSIERAHPLQPSNSRKRFALTCCMPFLHRKHGLPCDSPEPTSQLDVCPQLSPNDQNEPPEPRPSTKERTATEESSEPRNQQSRDKRVRADRSKEKVKTADKKSSKGKPGGEPQVPGESEQGQSTVREEELAKTVAKKFVDDLVGRVSGSLLSREGADQGPRQPKKQHADPRPVSSLALGKLVDGKLCASAVSDAANLLFSDNP